MSESTTRERLHVIPKATREPTADHHHSRLFTHILVGIGMGVFAGLLFGDSIRPLRIVSNGFMRLLQVNVLPYLLGSLIASLGTRGTSEMKLIAKYGSGLLLLVWALTLLLVALCGLALPPFGGASVFATSQAPAPIDWLDLYIPANLFHALANNLIPAVVLFGILAGIALGQVRPDRKSVLLQALEAFNEAMARVSRMILVLTPLGLFATVAVTAGEFRPEDLLRLHVWLFYYLGGTLLVTLWILPALVSRLTPVSYGRFLQAMRSAIVTAAAAGDVLVVLPLIAESAKELLAERGFEIAAADRAVSLAVPLLYNFPHAGKILSLAFLPFAAWFSGTSLSAHQLGLLVSAEPLSLFGSINAAMPFLLDLLHLPADLVDLFTVSSVVNSRFGSMAAAAHTAALSIVLATVILGCVTLSARKLTRYILVTAALVGTFLVGTRVVFTWVLPSAPGGLQTLASLRVRPPLARIGRMPVLSPPPVGRRLDEIQARATIRVGHFDDALPWAFTTATGDVVGYDIEAAHRLARELGVSLELVQVERSAAVQSLTDGRIDILMSGFTATVARATTMELSHPYSGEHVGFLVHDFDRKRFETPESLDDGRGMVVALPAVEGAADVLKKVAPLATARSYRRIEDVLKDSSVTAVLMPLERAYYWSRVHPEFAAVRPENLTTSTLTVYAMPRGERELCHVVDLWLETRKASGEADEAFEYWIRGTALASRPPRWSVVRNVLGWPSYH